MSKLNVELVTPEELVFSSDVHMVVVPGISGDFGVLDGHSPLVSTIRPGAVEFYDTDNHISKTVFVSDGFAEVTYEGCTILARNSVDVTGKPAELARLVEEASVDN